MSDKKREWGIKEERKRKWEKEVKVKEISCRKMENCIECKTEQAKNQSSI